MILRASFRTALPPRREDVALLVASAGVGGLVAAMPSLSIQVALLLGAATALVTVLMIRSGAILNPAWVIVAWLYLIAPIGWIVGQVGVGLSPASLLVVAPVPFVLGTLVMRPRSRDRIALLAPLVVLAVFAALSLSWSPEATYGAAKLNLWLLTGLLPASFILVLAPASPGVPWRLIAIAALVTAVALILVGTDTALYPGRRILFDSNPIWLGRAAFIGALVVLFGPFPPLAKLAMTPVMIVAGLLTVSLGPAVGFVVGAWAGAAEQLRRAERVDRRVALGWATLGLVCCLALVVGLIWVIVPGSSAVARLVFDDPNVTSRASYLGVSGTLFAQAPLAGIGIGGFASTGLDQYPHNLIAEIAVELGSIGIVLFLIWLALALRGAARSPVLVALVTATAVFSLFSGNLAGNAEFWMFSALGVARFPIRGARPAARGTTQGPRRLAEPSVPGEARPRPGARPQVSDRRGDISSGRSPGARTEG